MILARALIIVLMFMLPAAVDSTSLHRSGGFVSFDNMVVNADAIALVEVTSGSLRADHVPAVLYHVSRMKEVAGSVAPETCLEGPRGLRVGIRYLVFIQSYGAKGSGEKSSDCIVSGTISNLVPRAIEIITFSGEDFAKLDNGMIDYPKFDKIFPVHQNVSDNGKESTLVIGSWVSLQDMIDYVNKIKKRARDQ